MEERGSRLVGGSSRTVYLTEEENVPPTAGDGTANSF